MLVIEASFPAGRYHATPWGMHVNEGAIEWPPSPWRVLRALLACGFGRLGWREVPEVARGLLERLASTPPTYHLPEGQASHLRHYMPLYDGKTTKVLDAFLHVGTSPLAIAFDVELTDPQRTLLVELVAAMPYLGRAESWVEARLVEAVPPGLRICATSDSAPAPGFERVALLAPEPADRYAAFRKAAMDREVSALAVGNEQDKKPKRPAAGNKKELAKLEALYPRDLVEALRTDTATLQRQGWSQPPASRWLSYWRAVDAMRVGPRLAMTRLDGDFADTALLALSSDTRNLDVLPPMRDAVRRLDALHKALVDRSAKVVDGPLAVFVGREDGKPVALHRHATLVPLALGRRADRMDHVLVHAPMGFDARAREVLGGVRRTYAKGLPELFVALAGVGRRASFESLIAAVRPGRVWRSATPFVAPRHLKARGKDALFGQIQAELAARGLPAASRVEIEREGGDGVDAETFAPGSVLRGPERFRNFRVERDGRPPPQRAWFALRVELVEACAGPLSIGYGSHFGLGSFVPESA